MNADIPMYYIPSASSSDESSYAIEDNCCVYVSLLYANAASPIEVKLPGSFSLPFAKVEIEL